MSKGSDTTVTFVLPEPVGGITVIQELSLNDETWVPKSELDKVLSRCAVLQRELEEMRKALAGVNASVVNTLDQVKRAAG